LIAEFPKDRLKFPWRQGLAHHRLMRRQLSNLRVTGSTSIASLESALRVSPAVFTV
jgi:hypothetical protein